MVELVRIEKSGPSTSFAMGADRIGQNEDENYTLVRCYIAADNGNAGSTGSYFGDYGEQVGTVENITEFRKHSGRPFLPSGYRQGQNRWVDSADVRIYHNPDGGHGGVWLRMDLRYGGTNESHRRYFGDLPRIPKPPQAPGISSLSNITPTNVRVTGIVPDDMGAAIDSWDFQAATDAAFTQNVLTINHNGPTLDVQPLSPGRRYWFRLRAHNRRGWGPWSGSADAFVGLPAPTLDSWGQIDGGQLQATWTAPNPSGGLTGYRLQVARDQGFTSGVQTFDLGNVNTYAVGGLAGGRNYYARVAAITAGGVNSYSGSRAALLVLDSGDLDGWTRAGDSEGLTGFTPAGGLRRSATALNLETLSNGAGTAYAGSGVQRRITGLTIGSAYRFGATAQLTDAGAAARTYQLRVVSEGEAEAVTLTTEPTSLGTVEFVADETSAVVQIVIPEPVSVAGATERVESVAFSSIRLWELVTDYPVRLRNTVYESNLANHFDLACNSVGATWYVGKDGVTQFRLPGTALPVSAVFSDAPDATALHYIDVAASYDTRGMVNRLDVTNYGVDESGENEQNDDLVVIAQDSIDRYGVRSARLETNLYADAPYDESLNERLAQLLADSAAPRLFISSVKWNAQENPAAANALDVGQRVTVRFNGEEQDSQIVSLQHDITPRRWIVTVALRRI